MRGRQKQKRHQSNFNFRLVPPFRWCDYQRFAAQGFFFIAHGFILAAHGFFFIAHGFILAAHGFFFIAHGFIFALQGLFAAHGLPAAHGLALKPFCSDAL